MTTTLFGAPVCTLNQLENLFIEMTAKNCNQRCKHCYIDFPFTKNIKDFIPYDTIQKTLNGNNNNNLQCIYLTGAEPMTHPEFNKILRLCLKYANVCICTNGSLINEKKARFLRKVQDESNKEIIFKFSIDHYDELKNDEIRSRGSYRQCLNAIKNTVKYGFDPIINVTNYYNEPETILLNKFLEIIGNLGYDIKPQSVQINNWFDKNIQNFEIPETINTCTDCKNGRVLTNKGIYSCMFLANDHRGRCGADLQDYSKKIAMETPYCNTCLKNKRQVFGINFSDFSN